MEGFCTSSSEMVRGTEPTKSLTNVTPSAESEVNNEVVRTNFVHVVKFQIRQAEKLETNLISIQPHSTHT